MPDIFWNILYLLAGIFVFPIIQHRQHIKLFLVRQLMHPEIHARSLRYAYLRAFLSSMDALQSVAILDHADGGKCNWGDDSPLITMTTVVKMVDYSYKNVISHS